MSASGGSQSDRRSEQQTEWKRAVAQAAAREIPDGATVGLGSGTTSEWMLRAVAERARAEGLRILGVATSEHIAALAGSLGVPLVELDAVERLDMSFDGADEVALPGLDLIKGRGGALLREKMIASVSGYRIILVDTTKVVPALGAGTTIPVEVETFGWRHSAERLAALGCQVTRRPASAQPDARPSGASGATASLATGDAAPADQPFITDGGHYTLDLTFQAIPDIHTLAARIKATVGVVDHGLFLGMTDRLYIGGPEGVHTVDALQPSH